MVIFVVAILCLLMTLMSLTLTSCGKSEITPEFKERAPLGVTLIDLQNPGAQMSTMLKSLGPNRMPNGGGDGSLDWYDENGNGCGDLWTHYPPVPGFAWQNFTNTMTGMDVTQCVTAQSQFVLFSPTPPPKPSIYNTLTFRYRSTTPVTVVVRLTGRCGYIVAILPRSEWKDVSVDFTAFAVHSIMWYNSPTQPGVLEVDKVNLY